MIKSEYNERVVFPLEQKLERVYNTEWAETGLFSVLSGRGSDTIFLCVLSTMINRTLYCLFLLGCVQRRLERFWGEHDERNEHSMQRICISMNKYLLHGPKGLSPDEAVVGGVEAALSWHGGDIVVVFSASKTVLSMMVSSRPLMIHFSRRAKLCIGMRMLYRAMLTLLESLWRFTPPNP